MYEFEDLIYDRNENDIITIYNNTIDGGKPYKYYKGAYNFVDLNRLEVITKRLSKMLNSLLGYNFNIVSAKETKVILYEEIQQDTYDTIKIKKFNDYLSYGSWTRVTTLKYEDIQKIVNNIDELNQNVIEYTDKKTLVKTNKINYENANDYEKVLYDLSVILGG